VIFFGDRIKSPRVTSIYFCICFLLTVALGTSCSLLPRAVEYVNANVHCFGTQEHALKKLEYSTIWMGTPQQPYSGEPVVTLRLPGGITVRSDQLDVAWLRTNSDRKASRRARSLLVEQGWPVNSEELALHSYRFVVLDSRVLALGFGMWEPSSPPMIGDADGRAFHQLPLQNEVILQLFGPPETTRKWLPK
jgi:hypothetical protein